MKTLTKTVFAAALTALLVTSAMLSSFAAEWVNLETTASPSSKFNRIWVSGNVKIILTQGNVQKIEGAGNYDAAKTSVSTDGRTYLLSQRKPSR